MDKSYVIKNCLVALTLLLGAFPAFSQEIRVSGTVRDSTGTLSRATVQIKGISRGTQSDEQGKYVIGVPELTTVLVYSMIGYITQEITVNQQSTIDVILEAAPSALDEVVVVGYGSKSRRELTGAVGSLDGKHISEQVVTGFSQAMAGRIAGVQVVQNSGAPGASSAIRIRGVGTPGASNPLYVIDGMPIGDPNLINHNDIASIEVLKDASSAAIYGARAANGIVLITTKQGVSGKVKLDLNYYTGIQKFEKRFDMLNAAEYKTFLKERNSPFKDSDADVNWLDEISNPSSLMQNFNLNVRGGDSRTTYFTSVDYLDQQGIIKGTDFGRMTVRGNIQNRINDRLKIGSNITVGKSVTHNRSENSTGSAIGMALFYPPIVPVREAEGQYGDASEYVSIKNNTNPLAMVEVGEYKTGKANVLGNLFTEINILKGLDYRLNLGLNYENNIYDSYFPGYVFGVDRRREGVPNITKDMYNNTTWLVENILTYKFTISDKHNFTLLSGFTAQESNVETLRGERLNEVSKDGSLTSLNSSPSVVQRAFGGFESSSLASLLGRFDYSYMGKYLVTASIRQDGSSRFPVGKKWGSFPSISAGWNISEEGFFDIEFVNYLKIRGSWGQLGNEQIAPFQYLSTLGSVSYLLGGNVVSGVYPNNVANESITWEMSEQTDIGVDLGLFNNKLSVSLDYFNKLTKDILLTDPISSIYGYTDAGGNVINATKNAGTISNKGFEFSLGFKNHDNVFKWSIDVNGATLQNKVVSLGGGAPIINDMLVGLYFTRTDVNSQIGAFYGKVVEKVGEDGHFVFEKDEKGNDIQTIIGNPIPNFTYGFNVNASYKQFDFSTSFQGVAGNDVFATTLFATGNFSYGTHNPIKSIYEQSGKTAPLVSAANGADYVGSDWFVYDGSFLRMRSVQLGYTFSSKRILNSAKIDRFRVYISGQNLFTIDNYTVGLNPEVGATNNVSAGVDTGTYPAPKIITAGINLTF